MAQNSLIIILLVLRLGFRPGVCSRNRFLKREVADAIRSIFYASSEQKAREQWGRFQTRWHRELPSATKCLSQSLDRCLTFYKFPQEEWISIRTTNIIERLNKEFKGRTKPMEIVAGEAFC